MNHKRTPLGAGPISPEEDELDQANAGRKVSRADTRVARRQERRDDVAKRKQQQRDRAPAPTQRLGETDRHYAKRVRQGAIDMVLPDLQEASAPTAPTQVEIQNKSPDMVTISGATTKEGVTRYRPEGDPFEYEYDANTGTFSAFDSEGTPVITGVKEGDAAYAEFAKHAKGGQTSHHGGSAQEEVSPGALITDADYAQASDVDEFGYPIDSATPPEQMETSAVEVSEPPMSPDDPNQLPPMSMEESLPLPAEEALPVEEVVDTPEQEAPPDEEASPDGVPEKFTDASPEDIAEINARGRVLIPEDSQGIKSYLFEGPRALFTRSYGDDGLKSLTVNNDNVFEAMVRRDLSRHDWPEIKRQMSVVLGAPVTGVGTDPTERPGLVARLAARRTMGMFGM